MVRITNGESTLFVTKGAYTSMYASQGWKITDDNRISPNGDIEDNLSKNILDQEVVLPESHEENLSTESDQYDGDIDFSEVPISQMTIPQLKNYAQSLGLNPTSNKARVLRDQIREALKRE